MVRAQPDDGSDPRFVEYYARASQSEATPARFERIMERALGLLRDEDSFRPVLDVIDIGCGAGAQALLWAHAGHRVKAIDISEPLIAVGQQRAGQQNLTVEFKVGSATRLPFKTESADVVLLPALLEHVADWEACLEDAARVLRPGRLLYLSTSNCLCPHQQEFNLPLYSWYPGRLKRWCERRAATSRPQWANYVRYPAIHWFSYYGLRRWFLRRGFRTLDRFDVLVRGPLRGPKRLAAEVLKRVPATRYLAHVVTESTMVWAIKGAAA